MSLELLRSLFVYSPLEKRLLADYGDPPLIVKHSQIRRFTVALDNDSAAAKPRTLTFNLRVVRIPHYRGHKLPPLPLILCIHGLGGQLNQFQYLIDHFANFAEVVAIDLPGHGRSDAPKDWVAYTPEFLVQTILTVLQTTLEEPGREVVLVAHSMGTTLATQVAQKLGIRCLGLIALCPPVDIAPELQALQSKLGYIPAWLFGVLRAVDKLGGLYSPSVSRLLSPHTTGSKEADLIREKQLRWNLQVNSAAWMKTAYYLRPADEGAWSKVECPVYLVGAQDDTVTIPENVNVITKWLGPKARQAPLHPHETLLPAVVPEVAVVDDEDEDDNKLQPTSTIASEVSSVSPPSPQAEIEEDIVPTIVHDAGHICIVEKPEVMSGLISDFIAKHVDVKLSQGWQLAFLASESTKWCLKNENKWRQVDPVSDRIEGTRFRAMKTLRQDDEEHSPAIVEARYAELTDIVDISREAPPYDPTTFRHIVYHKMSTVSKLPPTRDEVAAYIALIDGIFEKNPDAVIGTHCHYGFNRTGFFLCCYMIERLGFTIKRALLAFRSARNPGIKHSHFIDELYVRYEL